MMDALPRISHAEAPQTPVPEPALGKPGLLPHGDLWQDTPVSTGASSEGLGSVGWLVREDDGVHTA